MIKPKYNIGDRVYYEPMLSSGIVKVIVNLGKDHKKDIKFNGYRYEVAFDYGRDLRLVSEKNLRSTK